MKVRDAFEACSAAARSFESRWTLRSLRIVDPELYERFMEQRRLWDAACVTGDDDEMRDQTEAMCRGWAAIAARMEDQPDDAYLIGQDIVTGFKVCIADQTAAMDRVRELHGSKVVFVTPNEVATILGAQQEILKVKGAYPGAEVIEIYPSEPRTAA